MKSITQFEDLLCWQSARELVRMIYQACATNPLDRDHSTKDQFKRAALSVMNNIAEGFARKGDKEFIRFLDISQSSCVEVKSMTYVLQDLNYLPIEKILEIRMKAEETKKLTLGLIRYLAHKNKGPKPSTPEQVNTSKPEHLNT